MPPQRTLQPRFLPGRSLRSRACMCAGNRRAGSRSSCGERPWRTLDTFQLLNQLFLTWSVIASQTSCMLAKEAVLHKQHSFYATVSD